MKRRRYYDAEPWYLREKTHEWYQQMEKTNEMFCDLLKENLDKNSLVLEVACGGGGMARYIVNLGVKAYLGFDFAETAVQNAGESLKNFSNAEIIRGDALDSTLYEGPYNVIIAHQFLHCLIGEDRKTWLDLCFHPVRKNNGIFLLSSMIGLPEIFKGIVDPTTRINTPGNRYYAEDQEIQDELKNAGYKIKETIYPEDHSAIYLAV